MPNKNECIDQRLGRRGFLKAVIVTGTSLVTAGLIRLIDSDFIDSALATPGTDPYYYGTDTSWAVDTKGSNASNFPQNFYIGRTGVGELIYNDSSFYSVAADKAGILYTHTYWNLKGPYYKWKGNRTPYQYGYDQGIKAASAWYDHSWSNKIGGKTIFADIEEGTSNDPQSDYYDGWRYYSNGNFLIDVPNNRAVLDGFLSGIKEYIRSGYNPGFNPGIYTRLDLWQSWFGGVDYDPEHDLVVWLAGNACGFICSPCGTCTTAKSEADSKFNSMKETAFGIYKTVIWQFFISECPAPDCADYDIARQNGYIKFLPMYGSHLPIIIQNDGQLNSMEPMETTDTYPHPETLNPYP